MSLRRILLRSALALAVFPAALYLGDWAVWHIRGSSMSTIHVNRIVVASLKGGKEEYYPDGSADLRCSLSLFQQSGSGACWYLARNPVLYDR